jgi:hypothetical protein
MTKAAVVELVGARPMGQDSSLIGVCKSVFE